MKRRGGIVLILGGLLLLAAAGVLSAYNVWDADRAGSQSEAALENLDERIPVLAEMDLPEELIPDYILNPQMDMPTQEVEEYKYIGRIDIPAIGISLPVMDSWSYPKLKIAPCRYQGSAYLDDLIIAAHNYERHFGNIKNLVPGDEVIFTDVDGNIFNYTVSELEQLEPTDTRYMITGDWDLTLFTCTLGGQYRVTVRCERVEELAPGL